MQGRAVRARKAHVRPGGPVGAWRASHATLWFWGVLRRSPVLYVLYVLYVLPRRPSGTSQTCRGCRGYGKLGSLEAWRLGYFTHRLEAWKFRGLEAWLFYPSPHPSPRRGALCSLFTVFCSLGRVSALPCWGVGQRPTPSNQLISQSAKIPFVSFVISKYSGSLREPSWFFVPLRVSPAGRTSHTLPAPHPSRACRALRSPWPWKVWPSGPARSVFRSPTASAALPSKPPNF